MSGWQTSATRPTHGHSCTPSLPASLRCREIVEKGQDKFGCCCAEGGGFDSRLEKNSEVSAVKVRCHTWYHHQVLTADEPVTDKWAVKESSVRVCVRACVPFPSFETWTGYKIRLKNRNNFAPVLAMLVTNDLQVKSVSQKSVSWFKILFITYTL